MTRGLTPAALAAVQAEQVARTIAVELLFDSGPARFSGAPFDFTIGGNTFLGLGRLGQVSAVEESAELRAYGLTISVSGVPADQIAIALTEPYQGRRGTVWEVPLNLTTWQPIAAPIVIFRGRMDVMEISDGEDLRIAVRLENRLADWERPKLRRYTAEDQKARHPGDEFFSFVSATAEKEIIWPSRTYRG